jgi:hypothetical protein
MFTSIINKAKQNKKLLEFERIERGKNQENFCFLFFSKLNCIAKCKTKTINLCDYNNVEHVKV